MGMELFGRGWPADSKGCKRQRPWYLDKGMDMHSGNGATPQDLMLPFPSFPGSRTLLSEINSHNPQMQSNPPI